MSCTIPTQAIDILRERMGSRALAERVPLWGFVEIIATCNFDCQHCYIAPCAEREDVMTLAQAETVFDKLAKAGTLGLLLTGGEIFTHRQFKEIYLAAKRRGFLVYLNTNAYMIGERLADFLAEWPPMILSISLYGLSDERYERVTGIPNAFRRVVKALDLLRDRGVKYELKCPAMTLTVDEIPAMRAFAEERGVTFRYDAIISPQEKGSTKPLDLQLVPEAVLDLERVMDPGLDSFTEYAGRYADGSTHGKVYSCGAGRIGLHVTVHGGVTTCTSSRQTVGNIFEQSFEEVWAQLGGKVERKFADGHPCATCKFRKICSGCPATVEQVTGLPEGYVQTYCRITHLRAKEIGLHATGIPRTVAEGIPRGIAIPGRRTSRALPILA